MDFDKAICKTGYGKFHIELTLACALCVLTVGFQNGLSAYVFPAAQSDLGLTSSQIGFLNVSFLFGGVLSAFLWGVLADTIGRRKVLIFTHLFNVFITVACAVNQYVLSLMVCRFLNGFLIGAPGSIIFSYFAEFQPPKYRASSVCYCGLFFTASWLLLPVLAWAILPINVAFSPSPFLTINSWRLYFIILEISELLAGLWFIKLPESPKYHMAKGEYNEALSILKYMYQKNTGHNAEDFPVKSLSPGIKLEDHSSEGAVGRGKTARILADVLTQIRRLFKPPLLVLTLLTCMIMFENMIGIFGLGLWIPELFIRFEKFQRLHPNETVSVKELSKLVTEVKNQTSSGPTFDSSVILSTVAMGISSLIVSAISGYLTSRLALRTIPLVTMVLGGLSSACIYWLTSSTQMLVAACIFQSTMVTANMSIGGVVVDLFPTSVSGIAICLVMCAGRTGAIVSNMVIGLMMDKHCEIPIFVVAANVLLGGVLCFFIKDKEHPRTGSKSNSLSDDKTVDISTIELRNISS